MKRRVSVSSGAAKSNWGNTVTSKNKINTVQDLRGIAILYVVLFHTGNIFGFSVFINGSSGVALFFLISGFIISYIHRYDKGLESAIIFAKKRMVRIYPPYVILFCVMLVLFLVSGKGEEFHRDFFNIIRNLFLIQVPSHSIHPYAWSLVYEIYYYVTFLFLVIIFRLGVISYCLLIIAPHFLVPLFLDFDVTSDIVPLSFNNLFFASGVLIGAWFDQINIEFGPFAIVCALIAFLVAPFLGGSDGYWLLLFTAVLFVVYSKSYFSIYFINLLGNSSYSIYLVHAVVLSILKNIIDDRSYFTFLLFLLVAVGLGHIYHMYVEKLLIKKASLLLRLKKK